MAIGIRARLAITLVALVAVTVAAIGVGVYAFVDASLRARLIADARQQVDYNLAVLLPGADPAPVDLDSFVASGLPTAFALARARAGDRGLRGRRAVRATGAGGRPGRDLARAALDRGIRRSWGSRGRRWRAGPRSSSADGRRGRRTCTSCSTRRRSTRRWTSCGTGCSRAALAAVGVALLVAGIISRWLLRPVADAARTARRIASGDLGARLPERRPRRGRPVGRRLQPDGGLAPGDVPRASRAPRARTGGSSPTSRTSSGRRSPRSSRRRRCSRGTSTPLAPDIAAGRGAAGHRRAPPPRARRRPDGDLALRRRGGAAGPGARRPRAGW